MDFDNNFNLLEDNGFDTKKINGKQIAVYTSRDRVEVFKEIEELIPNAVYDTTPTSKSSLGFIQVGKIKILVKPLRENKTPDKRGVDNEVFLHNEINAHTNNRPINVLFRSEHNQYEIQNCTGAKLVGDKTKGSKKADIILTDMAGVQHRFSVKQDNSHFWASCDTYFGEEAETIVDKAVRDKLTELTFHGTHYSIDPSILLQTTRAEKRHIIFGSDIFANGAVIIRSFHASDFEWIDRWLVINTTDIIRNLDDLNETNDVFFLIRNDKSRRGIKNYPGLRSTAIPSKRIRSTMITIER